MPNTTWNVNERVDLFGVEEGYGLDPWDETPWGSPDWTKVERDATSWVKES